MHRPRPAQLLTSTAILCLIAATAFGQIPRPRQMRTEAGASRFESPEVITAVDTSLPKEGYTISLKDGVARISGGSDAGLFYGLETLRQLPDSITAAEISDWPQFAHRGLMLDLSRHWFGADYVHRQIDEMARLKLNRLHLHLTDAAGWRLEIPEYPLLTEIAAYRPDSLWKDWQAAGMRWEGSHGGYLTTEDVDSIVRHAARNHITVIPEIEIPSHSEEVFAAYPELGCGAKPKGNSNYCAGSEGTYEFLFAVLDRVMELFPSKYIHIGGDEAPKQQWLECEVCRRKMADLGTDDPDRLQSYMMTRVADYVVSKGRTPIVWDDALAGDGPGKDAVILSWRGTHPDSVPHPVIMAPGNICYLDAYQDAPQTQPEAIGGYTPLRRVYSYKVPGGALGVQGNLWCEYIPTVEQAEYMLYPRLFAIAERGWSGNEPDDYEDFRLRALAELESMRQRGYNTFDLANEIGNRPGADAPIEHLAKGKRITYLHPYWDSYPAGGKTALTDGICGGWNYSDGLWQGFVSGDSTQVDILVDLERPTEFTRATADFMQVTQPGVWLPARVTVWAGDNPDNLTLLSDQHHDQDSDQSVTFRRFGYEGLPVRARYIRLRAQSARGCSFIDEFIVH